MLSMVNKFDIFTLVCRYMKFGHTPSKMPRKSHSICLKFEKFQSHTADVILTKNALEFRIVNHVCIVSFRSLVDCTTFLWIFYYCRGLPSVSFTQCLSQGLSWPGSWRLQNCDQRSPRGGLEPSTMVMAIALLTGPPRRLIMYNPNKSLPL